MSGSCSSTGSRSLGWLLTVVGVAIIVAGILMNMDIYFQQTSLFNTLIMLVLLAGGIGLVIRSLQGLKTPPPSAGRD